MTYSNQWVYSDGTPNVPALCLSILNGMGNCQAWMAVLRQRRIEWAQVSCWVPTSGATHVANVLLEQWGYNMVLSQGA